MVDRTPPRSGRPYPPPAPHLGPATAVSTAPRSDVVKASLGAAVVTVAFFAFRAAGSPRPIDLRIAAVTLVVAVVVVAVTSARAKTAAGPGWLAVHFSVGRPAWVRTDELASVTSGRTTLDTSYRFRDAAGRTAAVSGSDLLADRRLLAQVRKDVRVSQTAGAVLDERALELLVDAAPSPRGRRRGRRRR